MMKKVLLLILLSIAVSACGQVEKVAEFVSTKSESHTLITGTRIFMISPPGFSQTSGFIGLTSDDSALIQVMDVSDNDFNALLPRLSKEALVEGGSVVTEYHDFIMQNYPAKYICSHTDEEAKVIVAFGDTSFFVMVVGRYGPGDTKTENEIKKSIRSIYFDKEVTIDPLAIAPFTTDDSKSRFKFANYSSGMYFYTLDGKDKTTFDDEAFIMLLSVPLDPTSNAESVINMFVEQMAERFESKNIKQASPLTHPKHPTFQGQVLTETGNKKIFVYLVGVQGQDKVIAIQGFIMNDYETYIPEIKKFAESLTVKTEK